MARKILHDSAEAENRLTHDLESLFYVLLWICSNYSRPNNAVRDDAKHKHMPIMLWVDTVLALNQISNMKAGHIMSDEHFSKWILDYYPPYFEDLKVCSNELQYGVCSSHLTQMSRMTHCSPSHAKPSLNYHWNIILKAERTILQRTRT